MVYHLDNSLSLTPTGRYHAHTPFFHSHVSIPHVEEVADEFFELTVTDIHVMHSDLKRQA